MAGVKDAKCPVCNSPMPFAKPPAPKPIVKKG